MSSCRCVINDVFFSIEAEEGRYRRRDRRILTDLNRHELWPEAEEAVARFYRQQTGFVGKIDWKEIWNWIKENWDKILRVLFSVIMMFVMFI